MAITNPTSIVSKVDQYHTLCHKYGVNVALAAETAATKTAQQMFARKINKSFPHAQWSTPLSDGSPGQMGKNPYGVQLPEYACYHAHLPGR